MVKDGEEAIRIPHKFGPRVRASLDRQHAEFVGIPDAYIPWPYRSNEWADPITCPKCGRNLLTYVWGDDFYKVGYLTTACAGKWQWLARLRPTWLFFNHHWQMTLSHATRRKYAPKEIDAEV